MGNIHRGAGNGEFAPGHVLVNVIGGQDGDEIGLSDDRDGGGEMIDRHRHLAGQPQLLQRLIRGADALAGLGNQQMFRGRELFNGQVRFGQGMAFPHGADISGVEQMVRMDVLQ